MIEKCCKDCRFFSRDTDNEPATDGWCKRFPPVFVGNGHTNPHEDGTVWASPRVDLYKGCGEWNAANGAAHENAPDAGAGPARLPTIERHLELDGIHVDFRVLNRTEDFIAKLRSGMSAESIRSKFGRFNERNRQVVNQLLDWAMRRLAMEEEYRKQRAAIELPVLTLNGAANSITV